MIFPGFIGPTYQAPASAMSLERCINLLPERLETPGVPEGTLIYRRAPGLREFATLSDRPGRSAQAQDGRLFVMAGETVFEVFADGSSTALGDVAPSSEAGGILSGGSRGNQLLIHSGGLGYTYHLSLGTFAAITDPQFPAQVRSIAFIDGYGIAITPDRFALSALFDFATWGGDEGQRAGTTEAIVGGIADHETLWLMGGLQTEVWYNAGATSFPFVPIPGGGFITQGLAATEAVCAFDGAVCWLGQDKDGARVVWQAREYVPGRLSTHAIESRLAACTTVVDARLFSLQLEGHACLMLTIPSQRVTFVYDAATGLWTEWLSWNATTAQYESHRAAGHVYAFGKHLILDRESGALRELRFDTYDEAGQPMPWLRQTPYLAQEDRTITHHRFALGCQRGVGLASGQGSDPLVGLQFSDDDGQSWSATRYQSLGAQGKARTVIEWPMLGATDHQRVYRVSGSDPVNIVLTQAWLDVSVGVH